MASVKQFNKNLSESINQGSDLKYFIKNIISEAVNPSETFGAARDILGGGSFAPNVALHRGKDAETSAKIHKDFVHGFLLDSGYKLKGTNKDEHGEYSHYAHKDGSKVKLNSGVANRNDKSFGHYVGYTHSTGK